MRVAGLGFRSAAPLASLEQALQAALAVSGQPLDGLATLPQKAGSPVVVELAAKLGLPLWPAAVAGVQTPTQSARIAAGFGTGSVAEAAALTAAGPGARLVVGRVVSADGMATAAIAEGAGQ